tara:strand:+ start:9683 stop:11275 length:1593 start_codon:yes stop_codon:yes gene_type:complete
MAKRDVKFKLTAVDKTKAAFDKVTRGLNKVGTAAKGTAKVVGGVTVGLAGVSAALILASKKSLEFVDNIGKTATRTGIATDFIQAFQQGAIEAGSSIEQAQKGLEKFSRSVGDASRGLKTQADIFSDLGVEIRNSNGDLKGNTEILLEVADGIAALGSEAEKSTVLANLFGRSGMQFAQIFENGSEGLTNFVEEFRQLGFIISESGIRTAETFNDRVSQIKASIFGLQNQIVVGLAPAFLKLADDLKQFIIEQAAASGGFEQFGKDVAVSIIGIAQATAVAFASVLNFINGLSQIDTTLLNLGIRIMNLRGFELDLIKKDNIINIEDLNKKFDELLLKVNESSPAIKKFMEEFTGGLTDLQDPIAVFITNIEHANKSIQNVAVSSMKKLEDSIVEGLKTGKMAFQDFATFVVEQLLRIAIQQNIIAPITRTIGSMIPGVKIPLPSGEGGMFTGTAPRVGGVDGKGGFPAILHPGETVVDHTKGQSAGANVTFNISTVDAAGFDELLVSRKSLITGIINSAMNSRGKVGIL